MSAEQLASVGISHIEESILEVLTHGNMRQVDITKTIGIHLQWKNSHWIVNSLLNKLEGEKRVEPSRIGKNGQRNEWGLTKAERECRSNNEQ